jgi:hypothetical protein
LRKKQNLYILAYFFLIGYKILIENEYLEGLNMPKTYKNKSGYKKYANGGKFVHIAQAEKKVGGKIYKDYEVHHKDGNKTNNRVSNLAVLKKKFHRKVCH